MEYLLFIAAIVLPLVVARCIGDMGDPRIAGHEPRDEVEESQDLIAEIREQLDRAEAAVFRRDWPTYRLAMLNAHDLAGSLWS